MGFKIPEHIGVFHVLIFVPVVPSARDDIPLILSPPSAWQAPVHPLKTQLKYYPFCAVFLASPWHSSSAPDRINPSLLCAMLYLVSAPFFYYAGLQLFYLTLSSNRLGASLGRNCIFFHFCITMLAHSKHSENVVGWHSKQIQPLDIYS